MQDKIRSIRNYDLHGYIGAGTFAQVFLVRQKLSQQQFTLKVIRLKGKGKDSREVEILKAACSPFVVGLHEWFLTEQNGDMDKRLNLVMEYLPKSLIRVIQASSSDRSFLSPQDVLRYTYCLLRALADLSTKNICHRDIKPENILISEQGDAKLCDFGSAKILVAGEKNLSYICSRPYRPPELILGATDYTCQVDIWSLGCVLAEMLTNRRLFSGQNSTAVLASMIKIIGTPDPAEVGAMGVPQLAIVAVTGIGLQKTIRSANPSAEEGLLKLLSKMLVYNPQQRVTASQALSWQMFSVFKGWGKRS